jgi:hypothetical protein
MVEGGGVGICGGRLREGGRHEGCHAMGEDVGVRPRPTGSAPVGGCGQAVPSMWEQGRLGGC